MSAGAIGELFLEFMEGLMMRLPQGQPRYFMWDNLKTHTVPAVVEHPILLPCEAMTYPSLQWLSCAPVRELCKPPMLNLPSGRSSLGFHNCEISCSIYPQWWWQLAPPRTHLPGSTVKIHHHIGSRPLHHYLIEHDAACDLPRKSYLFWCSDVHQCNAMQCNSDIMCHIQSQFLTWAGETNNCIPRIIIYT